MPVVKVPAPTLKEKLKRFFLVDLIQGLKLTLKFNIGALTDRDAVAGKGIYTEQYPKVRPDVAPRFHGAPRLNMDPETHDTLCIACNLCALACPELCARRHVRLPVLNLRRISSWRPTRAQVSSGTARCSSRAAKPLNIRG